MVFDDTWILGSEPALAPAVAGDSFDIESSAGRIRVYVCGEGRPMLLIHSINAAASAAEVAPLIAHYAPHRRVFSIDLPGFGLSERSDRRYTPQLMTDGILAVLSMIHERVGECPDALALSLSCEFLARAAVSAPQWLRTLALVSPTGFRGRVSLRKATGITRGKPWLYALLQGPGRLWGRGLFKLLTRPGVIRYFLERTWGSARIDEDLWHTDIRMARWPGAEHAPLYFLSGELFSADVHTLYEQLRLPVWVSHGVRGDFTDYRQLALIANRPNWRIRVFDTGALPYFEAAASFCEEYDRYMADRE